MKKRVREKAIIGIAMPRPLKESFKVCVTFNKTNQKDVLLAFMDIYVKQYKEGKIPKGTLLRARINNPVENPFLFIFYVPEGLKKDFKDACYHARQSMKDVLSNFIKVYTDNTMIKMREL